MSKIEWTDVTWNPVRGCSRVSRGCERCYAERMAARFAGDVTDDPSALAGCSSLLRPGKFKGFAKMTPAGPRWTGRVELIPSKLDEPLHWRKPRRVFVNSMSDLFHEKLSDPDVGRVFSVMEQASRHTFQVLTKRPARMLKLLSEWESWKVKAPKNVWLGVSVEDQATADERIPLLLQTPAAVRFVSYEPALGPVDFSAISAPNQCTQDALLGRNNWNGRVMSHLDWVIVGGESGPGARPCHVEWIDSVVGQCREAGVACFVKQFGSRPTVVYNDTLGDHDDARPLRLKHSKGGDPAEWPKHLRVREFPK